MNSNTPLTLSTLRPAITPPFGRQITSDPSIASQRLPRLNTPLQSKESQSQPHQVQNSKRSSNPASRNASAKSPNSESVDSIDDLVHIMTFHDNSVYACCDFEAVTRISGVPST